MSRRKPRTVLARRKRNSARFALYLSLTLMGLLVVAGARYLKTLAPTYEAPPWRGLDFEQFPAVRLLQEYLRIDTSQPNAEERKGARFLADHLRAAGIEPTVELLGDRQANVWAFLEGEDRGALVLHNHIDTDPVPNPDQWRHDPHSGALEGPWIYGRGAYDMKGTAIAQLQAFIELKQSGLPLKRSVLFLATGSEEVGSDFGMKWVLNEHPEMAGRFWGMVTEGGALENRSMTDLKYWGIEVAQNRWVDVTLCSDSLDQLEGVRQILLDQDDAAPKSTRIEPRLIPYLQQYGASRDRPDLRELLEDPTRFERNPALIEIHQVPKVIHAAMHDQARPAIKVFEQAGGGYELPVRFYLLPGSDFEKARQALLPDWLTYGLQIVVHDEEGFQGVSSLDHPLYKELADALKAEYPDAPIGPYFLPWTATDSRFVRSDDVVSYGLSPFLVPLTETLQIGQINERLNLLGFLNGINVYRRLLFELAAESEPRNLWVPPKREEDI